MKKKQPEPESMTRNELASTIREEIVRFEQNILGRLSHPVSGCDAGDYGCCDCMPPGANWEKIDELIHHRSDVLLEFIDSNKEPLRKFFEKKGIQLKK